MKAVNKPLIFIYNLIEDAVDTYLTLDQNDKQTYEQQFIENYNETTMLGVMGEFRNRPKYYFIFMNQIQECYIQYASELCQVPRDKIEILVPERNGLKLLGSPCKYIMNDKNLMDRLLDMPNFDIYSFGMTEEYIDLCQALKGKASPIRFSNRQTWQKMKKYGTKSGARELIQNLNDPKIFMPRGKIIYASQNSYDQAIKYIVQQLKTESVVIKTQKFFGGFGVIVIKQKDVQNLSQKQKIQHVKSKLNKPFWKYFNIVVEEYIIAAQKFSFPCVQILIDQNGTVNISWFMDMYIINQTNYYGTYFLIKENYEKQTFQNMEYIVHTLGKVYAKMGYSGYINFDFIINKQNKIYLMQANVRMSDSLFANNYAKFALGPDYDKNYTFLQHPVISQNFKGVNFEKFMDKIKEKGINFTHEKKVGVILSSNEAFKKNAIELFIIAKTQQEGNNFKNQLYRIFNIVQQ